MSRLNFFAKKISGIMIAHNFKTAHFRSLFVCKSVKMGAQILRAVTFELKFVYIQGEKHISLCPNVLKTMAFGQLL